MDDLTDLEITETELGLVLKIKVIPGSKSNQIRGQHDRRLKIAVTAAAEKGKANRAVVNFLAQKLGVSRSQLEILSGHTDSLKSLLVKKMDRAQFLCRLTD